MTGELVVSAVDVERRAGHRTDGALLLAPHRIDVLAGELLVLAGPSGSGKTTLCTILAGWDRPDGGEVVWHRPVPARPTWHHLSVAPQRLALHAELDVLDNIALPTWFGEGVADDATAAPLDPVSLATDLDLEHLLARRPAQLSFGEQQRVAVARALLPSPLVAILDEPTGHQDQRHTGLVIDALLDARTRGTAVIVASHDPDVLDAADRVVTLRRP
ncbi:MAG: ATP-binding cassette domain-containing protein [Acidimicrobiales bacterium]